MPIFDYTCRECGYEFDALIFPEDVAKKNNPRCPKCKGKTKRIPSQIARMRQNWSTWNIQGS